MRGGNDRVTRGDKIKVWVKVGGSGGDNKDGLKTCCHLDERSEEKSFVLPKRFLASLEMTQELEMTMGCRGSGKKISRCARNDREGRNDRTGGCSPGRGNAPHI